MTAASERRCGRRTKAKSSPFDVEAPARDLLSERVAIRDHLRQYGFT